MRRLPLVLAVLTVASLAGPLAGSALASTTLLGNTSVAGGADNDAAGSAEAFRFTAAGSGQLGTASVYVDSGTDAKNLMVGVYSDRGGTPGTLLASGVEATPGARKWNQISLSSGAAVAKGTTYWLAVLSTGGTIAFRDSEPSGQWGCSQNSSSVTWSTLAQTWSPGVSWPTCGISAYVSAGTSTPPPPPPAPVNTSVPTVSGQAVQGQTLNLSTGGWSNSPSSYNYAWEDCDSTGANCTLISGAAGASYALVSSDVGHTVRGLVIATNSGGSGGASSAPSAVVSASTQAAPANMAPPAVTGQTVSGQTLTTSNGSWSGSPTGYTYAWEDCNTAGGSCTLIGGANASTYTLTSTDVGGTVAVVVTAKNAGGSAAAISTPVGPVTAPVSGGSSTGCFASPGACGFPDPKYGNVGAPSACSSYPTTGGITTSSDGQVIQNETITGTITVENNNVTIKNVCILMNGGGRADGTAAVVIDNGSNTMIANSTIGGLNTSNQSIDEGVRNWSGSPATLSSDYIYNCGECIHDGPWTITNTYAIANGMQGTNEHIETIYCDAGPGYTDSINANHSVLLAPTEGGVAPVAAVFCNTNNGSGGACSNQITVSNSLLAGGAYTVYTCASASSVGSSKMSFTNDRFARSANSSGDANGYWPQGGEFGLDSWIYCPPTGGQTWSGNVWDDNNSPVAC
jgi:hypothetical protein